MKDICEAACLFGELSVTFPDMIYQALKCSRWNMNTNGAPFVGLPILDKFLNRSDDEYMAQTSMQSRSN